MTAYIISAGQSSGGFALNSGDTMTVLSGGSAVNVTVNPGGNLYVSGGGSAIDTTIEPNDAFNGPGGSATVFSGGMTTGTNLAGADAFGGIPGAVETVLSGGSALATNMSINAELFVSGGGAISGTTGSNAASIFMAGTASATILENSNEAVLSGGVDYGATLEYAGEQSVAGSAFGATVAVSASQAVEAGGLASGTIVNGGSQVVLTSGTAAGTVLTGGSELVSGTASGLTLGDGTVETVIDGGVTYSTTVNNGGIESVSSGGTVSNTTVNSGGTENIYFSGLAIGTTSNAGAFVYSAINAFVSSGVTSSGLSLSATGVLVVLSGGTMIDLTVNSAGNEYVSAGGTASGTTIIGDGVANIWGTDVGAVMYGTPPPAHSSEPGIANEYVMSGGVAIGATLSGGSDLTVSSGGVASNTLANGVINPAVGGGDQLLVLSGGLAFSTTLVSGGEEQIDNGVGEFDTVSAGDLLVDGGTGSAISATVSSGGSVVVYAGSAISTTVSSGGALDVGDLYLPGSAVSLDAVLLSGGTENVVGGTSLDTVVEGGASISASWSFIDGIRSGITSDTIVESGGTLSLGLFGISENDVVEQGGIAYGGEVASISGMSLSGTLSLTSAANAHGVTVFSGGTVSVADLSFTSATTILSGGTEYIFLSATALSSLISGGIQYVSSGGKASNTVVGSGGFEIVSSGGSAASATVSSGGNEVVSFGGVASATTVNSGGSQTVFFSGTASGTKVLNGGFEFVSSGGVASATNVAIGGSEVLFFGGAANFVTVSSGGVEVISSGGSATSTTVSIGGAIDVPYLSYASGGTASVTSGDFLTVSVGGQTYSQQLAGGYAGDTFELSPDSGSGTLLTLESAVDVFTLTGVPATQSTSDTASITPLANVIVGDSQSAAFNVFVVVQQPGNGTLYSAIPGTVSTDGTTFAFNGTAAQIQAALRALVFQPAVQPSGAPGVTTGLSVELEQGFDPAMAVTAGMISAQTTVTATSVADPLAITLPPVTSTTVLAEDNDVSFPAFAGATITDENPGAQDATTIALSVNGADSDANGTLSGTGLTKTGVGTYLLAAASPAVEQAALQALTFAIANTPGTTTASLLVSDGVAPDASAQMAVTIANGGTTQTITTNSVSYTTVYANTPVSQTVQAYSTAIEASVGSTVVYDQTFALPYSDPAVQAAVAQADSDLAAEVASPGQPVLAGSSSSSGSTTSTTPGGIVLSTSSQTATTTFGPAIIGPAVNEPALGGATQTRGIVQIVAGQQDINIVTNEVFTNTQTVTTTTTNLLTQSYTIAGTQFRHAAGTVTPVTELLHVGDPGTVPITVSNTAAADGFSESLLATLAAVTGNIGIAAAGPTEEIAAGSSDASSLRLDFSTASAGTISGTATVDLTSDGGTGSGSIDGLGTTSLGTVTVPVNVTVVNYATAAISSTSTLLTQTGPDNYVLNFGTIEVGVTPTAVTLAAGNDISSPADALDGAFSINAENFLNIRFDPFSTLAAGLSLTVGTIVPDETETGNFSETVTLTPTDDNGAGFTLAQTPVTVTVDDDVVATDIFTLTGVPATLATTDTASITPFANANVGDSAGASFDTYVVVSQPANGTLYSPIAGAVSTDGSTFVFNGTAAQIQAALRSLVFQPALQPSGAPAVTTGISVELEQGLDPRHAIAAGMVSAQTTVTATSAVDPLAITLPPAGSGGALSSGVTTFPPFAGVTITDDNPGAQDSTTIVLAVNGADSDANGTLSGTGLTKTAVGTYVLAAADPAAEQAALQALAFATSNDTGTTTMSLLVSDGVAPDANAQTSVTMVPNPGGSTINSTTTQYAVTTVDVPVSQTVQAYSTTIEASVGSTVVFDQTFALPFSDPTVQAAVAQADADVQAEVASPGQPVLTGSSSSSGSTTSTTPGGIEGSGTTTATPIKTFGPASIGPTALVAPGTPGPEGILQILGGQVNINDTTTYGLVNTQTVTTTTTNLLTQSYTIAGTQFRHAAGSVTPVSEFVHVGDPGTVALTVANTAAADGFSENLLAAIAAVTGNIGIAAVGPTGEIAAGSSDASSLQLDFSTASAGMISGTATVDLTSDGGTGSGSIDGLGTTSLGTVTVPVDVTVDNYATAAIASTSTLLTQTGPDSYLLNFGTVEVGTSPPVVTLAVGDNASGPADALDGAFSVTGPGGFNIDGLAPFTTLAAGSSLTVGTIQPSTAATGPSSETITLTPTDDNGAGFTLAQTPVTVTVEDDVVSADTITLTGVPATLSTTDTASIPPFASANVGDTEGVPFNAFVVVQQLENGILSSPIGGAVSADGSTFAFTGTAAQIQAALRSLVFQPALQPSGAPSVTTGLSVELEPGASSGVATTAGMVTAQTAVTATSVVDPLAITLPPAGLPRVLSGNSSFFAAFAGVTITDDNPGAQDTTTIVLSVNGTDSDANGTLSGTGLSKTGVGTYVLAATAPAAEQTALQALLFTIANDTGTTTMSLLVSDGIAPDATAQTTVTMAPNPGGSTVVSNGTVIITTYVNIPVSQTIQAYSTTIEASAGSTVVYDQTFALPYSDPMVQAAVTQADADVAAAVASPGLPMLAGSSSSSGTTTSLTPGGTEGSTPTVSTTTTFGPAMIGPYAGAPGPYGILPILVGQTDTNVLETYDFTNTQTITTTTTNLLTQSYTITGTQYRHAAGTVVPVTDFVHVGDPGMVALTVGNTAAADGFSENLLASLAGVSGELGIATAGPTGEIAAGSSDASSLKLDFSTTAAGTISGTATVDVTSDGGTRSGSIDGLGTSMLNPQTVPVSVTVDNYANPVFEDVSGAGTFTAGATAYTLDLGTITQGTGPFVVDLGVLNNTTGPSDAWTGDLFAIGSSAFINSGLAAIGTLAAGQSDIAPEITLATDTTGTFSETITLTGTGSNPGGFSAALPAETLTVTGTVAAGPGTVTVPPIPPAIATVLTPTPIDFGNAHVLDGRFQSLDIGNTATTGAAALDVTLPSVEGEASASGDANASGDYISGLAAGGADSSIDVGIVGTVAGAGSGTITLGLVSDAGTLGTTALPSQNITVLGTFYREAAAALLPLNAIVHVGDPGTISLPVGNSDPADGFSENLIAMLIGTTGSLGIAAAGPTDEIAAGQTNTNALALSFATTQAGTVSGTATVGLTSDGGTGIGSIDGLGQTTLTADTVPVSIVVDHYATPVLTSDGSLTSSGPDSYVLNLGTATQGAAVLSADLNLGNSATGPADWLDGNFNATGSGQFNNALSPVTDITAGTSADAGTVSLSTNQTGVFSETIMLSPTDANADGFSDALTARNITVTGTVVAPIGTTEGDVHMVTYDGLRYDFQAVGDYVLSRSTEPGDTFQIQIETAAAPSLGAVSITTEVAAQVGSDVVTFGLGQVEVDGAADTGLNAGDPVQDLAFGQLQQLSSSEFRLTWANGEALTVTDAGPYLNTSVSLPATDAPGSVQGLLGGDSGQASDFQLADGRVMRQPLSDAELLGAFASAWRGNSLLVGVSPMQFIYTDGTNGQTVLQATAAGQVLSAGPDVNVLSDADGFGVTFLGTLGELANETITGFSAKDVIDVSGLNSATAVATYAGGLLTVSDGTRSGGIKLSGPISGGFQVTSDQHGGSLITRS